MTVSQSLPMNFGGIAEAELSSFDNSRIVVWPVSYEGTVSYGGGTGKGAMAIVDASRNMELYDEETDAETYKLGIHTLDDGTVSSNNRLDWICGQPPTIDFPSTHAEVAVGSNLTLTATLDNHINAGLTNPVDQIPQAQLQWYLHDQPLEGQTNRSLTLRNARITDGGQYSLVARNVLGSSTNRLTVQVGTAPVFTSVLSDQCKLRNTALAVTNLAVNGLARPELTNAPSYQWHFAQGPITRATNSGYRLDNLQLTNAGL